MVRLGLGRRDTWLELGQENVFGLKYLVLLPQTGLEKSQHLILCGFCDHKHSCKLSQSLSKKFPIVARLQMLKSSFDPRDHWLVRLQHTGKEWTFLFSMRKKFDRRNTEIVPQ